MTVHICRGPRKYKRIKDEVNGKPRWCFRCRKVQEFRYTFDAPDLDPEDDPWLGIYVIPAIRCAGCQVTDADLFPGREREWEG